MAKIKIDHDHGLGMDQAREKLEQLAERLRDKYKLKLAWSGDKVNIKGLGIKGDLILVEGNLSGTLDVPFILKSKVEKKLDEKIGVEFPA